MNESEWKSGSWWVIFTELSAVCISELKVDLIFQTQYHWNTLCFSCGAVFRVCNQSSEREPHSNYRIHVILDTWTIIIFIFIFFIDFFLRFMIFDLFFSRKHFAYETIGIRIWLRMWAILEDNNLVQIDFISIELWKLVWKGANLKMLYWSI